MTIDLRPAVDPATDNGEVVVLNRDLFFGVRIGNTLRGLGYRVAFAPDTATFATKLRTADVPPVLAIVDLSAGVDWDVVRELTTAADNTTPVLVFGSHTDVAGRRAAKAAGVTRVVSNGDFHRQMVSLVRRYARSETV